MKTRNEFPELLKSLDLVGKWVELGVARGLFSEVLAQGEKEILYSIDCWADHHDEKEFQEAKKRLGQYDGCTIVRSTFENAVGRFPDNYFDFIYIDGYAHTGQNGGKTLRDWWPKLVKGGVFAGHDYHPRWLATVRQVDRFVKERDLTLNLTTDDKYNSWWVRK